MTTTLLDRLTAAIDEDERIALEAQREQATPTERRTQYPFPERVATAVHFGRHSPRAVLIRCAADRKTVQRHAPVQGPIRTLCATCHHVTPNGYAMRVEWPCPTLLDRAAAYNLTVEED